MNNWMMLPLLRLGRLTFIYERFGAAKRYPGGIGFRSDLRAILKRHDGTKREYKLGSGLVTDAGVGFMVDDWDNNAQDITNINFHDSGTGTVAAAVTDTDLGVPAGPTTRATGTKSQPAANQIRSVGTISYTATLAITEWGLFNQAARGAGSVLWDRKVFAAINVVNGDSIQFTYTCTINSGG